MNTYKIEGVYTGAPRGECAASQSQHPTPTPSTVPTLPPPTVPPPTVPSAHSPQVCDSGPNSLITALFTIRCLPCLSVKCVSLTSARLAAHCNLAPDLSLHAVFFCRIPSCLPRTHHQRRLRCVWPHPQQPTLLLPRQTLLPSLSKASRLQTSKVTQGHSERGWGFLPLVILLLLRVV